MSTKTLKSSYSFESYPSVRSRIQELQRYARKLKRQYGKEITDQMNVVFWAKDDNGTPCLCEGFYNNWCGDSELTISDLAEGCSPEMFLSKIQAYIDREPEFILEYLSEKVIRGIIEDLSLSFNWVDLQKVFYNKEKRDFNYDALYEAVKSELGDKTKEDFIELCKSYEEDSNESFINYGWEYSPVEQGNLFWGRSTCKSGPTFGEVIGIGWTEDIREWDGARDEEEINKDGLLSLAEAIKTGTTEPLRW